MTDPVTMGLATLATGVAAINLLLSIPRPPTLDAERWFKVILANLLVGEVDTTPDDEQTFQTWMDAVKRRVLFHPDARHPERVIYPAHDLSEGERALVDRMVAKTDVTERWRHLYEVDETGLAARLDDPNELGRFYDPKRWTTQATWLDVQRLGAGDTKLLDVLAQQTKCIWVLVETEDRGPDVMGAVAGLVTDPIRVPAGRDELLAALLSRGLPDMMDYRVVFVATGAGIQSVLDVLHAERGLRDNTSMVLAVDPVFDAPWMAKNFTHHLFDTERAQRTPYAALQWLDLDQQEPIGSFGRPLTTARFPEVPSETLTQESVQPLELGVLPHDSDPDFVARGLVAFVGLWILAAEA